MKLINVKKGTNCILKRNEADRHFTERAVAIGLAEGTEIEVVSNQSKMPLLVYARDTLIAINRKKAEEIEVELYV